jgi:hypothetical protein
MQKKNFPNGFTSWAETHFEIARFINTYGDEGGIIGFTEIMGGMGALYELAVEWTDEFENQSESRNDEDGQFFDELQDFLSRKNNPSKLTTI